jgi:hypothetical protein
MYPRNRVGGFLAHAGFSAISLLGALLLSGCAATQSTPHLSYLTVTPMNTSVALGETAQFKVEAGYSNGSTEDVTGSVTWKSLVPAVATVDDGGLASSVSQGSVTVLVTKSGINGSALLTVSKAALTSIAITAPTASIPSGLTAQLHANGTYTDKSVQDITSLVTWSTAQPNILAVNATGLAASKSVGTTGVTASLGTVSASSQVTVSPANLASIAVQASQSALPLGGGEQFRALGAYTDGTVADITTISTWTSSAPGTVSINPAGVASSHAVGSAAITAALNGIVGTAPLTISSANLVSIAVTAGHSLLPLGGGEQLTATGTYTDGSTKDLTASATWTSSAPTIADISPAGAVTTKSLGSATLSASSSGITGTTGLTVSSAALVSIAVTASHSSLPLGNGEQLTATGTYTDGSTKDLTATAAWTSSAPTVLSISGAGALTTKSVGAAIVSASSSGIVGTANLSVSRATLVGISIAASANTVPVGESLQLSAIGSFTDGSTQDLTSSSTWSSSSPAIVSLKGPGLLSAVAVGTAGVLVSSGGMSASENVSVSGPALTSLNLSPAGPTVPIGSSLQLSVTGNYSDGSTQNVTSQVAWSVVTPAIASITSGGLASGLQVGSTVIEASLSGVQTSDTLTVQPLFTVAYFDATSGIDSTIRITNPATSGENLCAMVYVFDQDQQMSECCGCLVSQDGLLTLSLNKNLLSNPLTGAASKSGTVMLVAADYAGNTTCNASAITPAGTVLGWSTHLNSTSSLEDPFSSAPLPSTLSSALQAQCSFVQQLGSGQGQCTCGASH